MKGLVSNCISDATRTVWGGGGGGGGGGAEFSLYLLLYIFPLFSEIFISIDEYAN